MKLKALKPTENMTANQTRPFIKKNAKPPIAKYFPYLFFVKIFFNCDPPKSGIFNNISPTRMGSRSALAKVDKVDGKVDKVDGSVKKLNDSLTKLKTQVDDIPIPASTEN